MKRRRVRRVKLGQVMVDADHLAHVRAIAEAADRWVAACDLLSECVRDGGFASPRWNELGLDSKRAWRVMDAAVRAWRAGKPAPRTSEERVEELERRLAEHEAEIERYRAQAAQAELRAIAAEQTAHELRTLTALCACGHPRQCHGEDGECWHSDDETGRVCECGDFRAAGGAA